MLHPVIASREVTRYILDTFGLHTKKRFGQNFLINESVVRGIAEKAKIGPGDLVLEVGPGIGTLTQALAETGADVKSVEIDESLLPILRKTLEGYDNVEIIHGDILKVDLKDITGGKPFTVAANLPYYITTPIIFSLLEANLPLKRIVVMVQKKWLSGWPLSLEQRLMGPFPWRCSIIRSPSWQFPFRLTISCRPQRLIPWSSYVKKGRAPLSMWMRLYMLRSCGRLFPSAGRCSAPV